MHAVDPSHLQISRQPNGFTLVEVLAALVIVSLGMLGVIEAVSQTANNGVYLRERTLAHWVAMNRLTEVRLEPRQPAVGTKSDEVEMAGRRWRWSMDVTQTEVESMRRIDVKVGLAESKDESLASVSGFYGSALGQAGSTAALWPGGALASGNPNDPNNPKPTDPSNPDNPQDPGTPPNPDNPTAGGDSPPRPEPTNPEPTNPEPTNPEQPPAGEE